MMFKGSILLFGMILLGGCQDDNNLSFEQNESAVHAPKVDKSQENNTSVINHLNMNMPCAVKISQDIDRHEVTTDKQNTNTSTGTDEDVFTVEISPGANQYTVTMDKLSTNTSIDADEDVFEEVNIPIDSNPSLDDDDEEVIADNPDMNRSTDANSTDMNVSEETSFPDEPYYSQQWYLERNSTFYSENDIDDNAGIHAEDLLTRYTGKGVTIAIIDDGLDVSHEEINTSIVATYDITTQTPNVSHNTQNAHHGTAVTGIIASGLNRRGIVGIARESHIIFLKYRVGMSDSETIELFYKADELGADIINCSWGTYDVSPAVKETIQDLACNGRAGKGTIIIFAVGNNNRDMGNDESAIPEVIAVGSTDRDNLRAWYSNYGKELDVLAPGGYEVGIATIDPIGRSGMGTTDENYLLANDPRPFIGSSASAPIVSGVIALMLEKDSNMTRVEVEEVLKNRSEKIGNLEYVDGWNRYYGYGKLNLNCILNDFCRAEYRK